MSAGLDLSKTVGAQRHTLTGSLSARTAVFIVALPLLFLHVHFQPTVALSLGGTTARADLSDLAVVAVVIAAIVTAVRDGTRPLHAARLLWAAAAALLVWIAVGTLWGKHVSSAYPFATHAVTAVKFGEYALLAPALPVLLRGGRDVIVVAWTLTVWSAAASAIGVLQFFGTPIFSAANVGSRQGSFLGASDFAALSGAVFLVGLVGLLLPRLRLGRTLVATALLAGAAGLVVAAAVASALGVATALVAVGMVALFRRELPASRVAAAAAVAAVAAGGVVALRGGDLASFARFIGTAKSSPSAHEKTVQTYAHHTLLAWIGLQIWRDHPLLGAGWQATNDPATFVPHVAAAKRRFPEEPPAAFPSATRNYGVQNVWVEALADLGLVGLALLVLTFAAAAVTAVRAWGGPDAAFALAWTALVVWLWTAQGLVAGVPLDALTWLGFGLAATAAALRRAHA